MLKKSHYDAALQHDVVAAPAPTPAAAALAEPKTDARAAAISALRRTIRALEAPPAAPDAVPLGPAGARLAPQGMARGAVYEVSPESYLDGPAATGFALALAGRALRCAAGDLFWVRAPSGEGFGAPYGPGLCAFGLPPERIVCVRAPHPREVPAILEEIVRTRGVGAVIGQVGERVELAAGRRLQFAAQSAGGLALLLRPARAEPVLGARLRWRVAAAQSRPPDWALWAGVQGRAVPPGATVFDVRLEKGRAQRLGQTRVEWNDAAHGFCSVDVLAGAAPRQIQPGTRAIPAKVA